MSVIHFYLILTYNDICIYIQCLTYLSGTAVQLVQYNNEDNKMFINSRIQFPGHLCYRTLSTKTEGVVYFVTHHILTTSS